MNDYPNIISSDCLGAIIYKSILKTEYANQFMSTLFSANEFNKLVLNINTLDFSKIKPFTLDTPNWNHGEITYGISIDNTIKYICPHHNNLDEIISLYKKRYKRLSLHKLVFIMDERVCKDELNIHYSYDDMVNFTQLKTKHKKLLITQYKDFKKYETDTCKVFIKDKIYTWDKTIELAKIIWDEYKNYILK